MQVTDAIRGALQLIGNGSIPDSARLIEPIIRIMLRQHVSDASRFFLAREFIARLPVIGNRPNRIAKVANGLASDLHSFRTDPA